MRKRPVIQPRVCAMCGSVYTPNSFTQKFCHECGKIADKQRKHDFYVRKFPDSKPKTRCQDVCCVCGAPFSSHFDGKPYCNKHYLRMKLNGTPDPIGRKRKNTYDVQGDTVVVTTSSGKTFLVDTADLEQVQMYSWCFSKTGYLVATVDHRTVKLHRYLLQPDASAVVDHINGDPADNRRCNLRVCTVKDNARNAAVGKNNRTGVTGVKLVKSGRYVASIMVNRKHIVLGTFDTLEEAASVRREAEQRYFGEFSATSSRTSTIASGTSE